jgi:hypothetical protein
MGGKMSVPYKVAEVFWLEMEKVELELAVANAKLASVRELQGYTMEGCYLVKSESPFKGNWNGDYVATADLEKLLFSPTMRAVDEEVGR